MATRGDTDVTKLASLHGEGLAVAEIARRLGVSNQAVRYHLKRLGLNAPTGPDFMTEKTDPDSDEALGIGQEDVDASLSLDALMSNPALAKLIDAAVATRVAQLGVAPTSAAGSGDAMTAFTETLKHLIDAQSQQMPGYIKPLPADELDRRASGRVEMFALLKDYERLGTPPLWTVGESGFIECTNMQEFAEGDKIRTYLPPVEDFIPENREAKMVHEAMMRWLGGRTPSIGEQVEAAHKASKLPPLVTGALQADRKVMPVEKVSDAPVERATTKRRTMGTIVQERREIGMADRAGGVVGPAFTEAA